MSFEQQWRERLPESLAAFAALAVEKGGADFTYGYLAAGVLWPVREEIQRRDDEVIDLLTDLIPVAYKRVRQVIDDWPEEKVAAAQALSAATGSSSELREGLRKLVEHFDAATTFARHVQPHIVSEEGQTYTIDQIKAALVNVGGIMNIQSLVIIIQQTAPKLHELYAGNYVAGKVRQLVDEYLDLPFVARSEEQEALDALVARGGRMVITAPAGYGKTALLTHWMTTQQTGAFVAYHFFSNRHETTSLAGAFHSLLRQLHTSYYKLEQETLPSSDVGEEALRDALSGLVNERGAQPDQPLVILLDALDEAEPVFKPPFHLPLPERVSLVVSTRTTEDGMPSNLRSWLDGAQQLSLQYLAEPAVANWLCRAGGGKLNQWARQPEFVRRVVEKTEGYPLYLRYLIDDFLQAAEEEPPNPEAVLTKSPTGFSEYVRKQFENLPDDIFDKSKVRALFVLLTISHGPLLETEVSALTKLFPLDLAKLPWQVTRWFNLGSPNSNERTYAFAHPRLAEEFNNLLGAEAQLMQVELLNWCTDWHRHRSPYAVRYYATHLQEAGEREALYQLARNDEFLDAQAPLEINLPLQTLQTALRTAATNDDVSVTAVFLLRHARWVAEAGRKENPLQVAHKGDPQRAFQLADLYPAEERILWYLVICWELTDAGHSSTVAAALDRLLQTDLPALTGENWQNNIAIAIIPYLIVKEPAGMVTPAVTTLMERFIGSRTLHRLANELAQHRLFSVARQISDSILDYTQRAEALREIAAAQAQAGD
ncbi:MAG: ATP-binding protein, partial [Chloroflexota bacterium]